MQTAQFIRAVTAINAVDVVSLCVKNSLTRSLVRKKNLILIDSFSYY